MSTPDLNALLSRRPIRGKFAPEVAEARRKEQSDRAGNAQSRAARALRALHPEDWRSLYEQAREQLDEERGPLPGGDDA